MSCLPALLAAGCRLLSGPGLVRDLGPWGQALRDMPLWLSPGAWWCVGGLLASNGCQGPSARFLRPWWCLLDILKVWPMPTCSCRWCVCLRISCSRLVYCLHVLLLVLIGLQGAWNIMGCLWEAAAQPLSFWVGA